MAATLYNYSSDDNVDDDDEAEAMSDADVTIHNDVTSESVTSTPRRMQRKIASRTGGTVQRQVLVDDSSANGEHGRYSPQNLKIMKFFIQSINRQMKNSFVYYIL